jgi:hypothetical protein
MTDPRKLIFDAVRTARGGKAFDQMEVRALDNILDALTVPRAKPASKPVSASSDDPIPSDYFEILAKIESGNRPYVKAASSSASGLFQFIRSTWRGEGGQWGADMTKAFGGLTPSVAEQHLRVRSFTMKNVDALRKAGVPINSATLYASHFLGVGTAIKMLRASHEAVAASIAGSSAASANPSILGGGRTVRQFREWLERKTGARP